MTKFEKKALLDYISQLESQKSFLESELCNYGFSFYLDSGFPVQELSLDERASFYLGKIHAYRACLSVINFYFCYYGK